MEISFSVDTRQGQARLQRVPPATVRAVGMAGGDAIRAMRTDSSRKIRERKAFKAGAVSKKLQIIWPSSKEEKLWRLRIPAETMPIWAIGGARQTRQGVTVAINAGARVLIKSAFIATMKSGHQGVFVRYGTATRAPTQRYKGHGRYAGSKRQPIKELYTTRIVDVFQDPDVIPAIMARGKAAFLETYGRVLPLELAKSKA